MKKNKLYCQDCIQGMKELEPNSIDAIVTDAPYGLEFMGKEWDTFKEIGNSKTMATTQFTTDSGKPRFNLPLPRHISNSKDYQQFSQDWATEALRVLKPGGHLLSFGGTRTYHRMTCGIEDAGFEIRDCIMWIYGSGFPKSLNIGKAIDKRGGMNNLVDECAKQLKKARKKRNITKSQADKMFCKGTTNYSWFEGRPAGQRLPSEKEANLIMLEWKEMQPLLKKIGESKREVIGHDGRTVKHSIFNIGISEQWDITTPSTPGAIQWDGWGTALKPAVEPIVVARKPFKGTVADNVLKYGTGGLNIDVSRIPHNENLSIKGYGHKLDSNNQGWGFKSMARGNEGRYPSNIILDDVSADILGGASRFFYVAKVSKRERNIGCKNNHPTIKPLRLMEYLVKLVCPEGELVLDPFAGSGTTLMACKRAGCDYIGFEKDKEYCDIAKARIKATVSLHGWI